MPIISAYPDLDWPTISESFIQDLGLTFHPFTTQIEPHDFVAEICHNMIRLNTIKLDLARDILGLHRQWLLHPKNNRR